LARSLRLLKLALSLDVHGAGLVLAAVSSSRRTRIGPTRRGRPLWLLRRIRVVSIVSIVPIPIVPIMAISIMIAISVMIPIPIAIVIMIPMIVESPVP
jgi:hypothetical protein